MTTAPRHCRSSWRTQLAQLVRGLNACCLGSATRTTGYRQSVSWHQSWRPLGHYSDASPRLVAYTQVGPLRNTVSAEARVKCRKASFKSRATARQSCLAHEHRSGLSVNGIKITGLCWQKPLCSEAKPRHLSRRFVDLDGCHCQLGMARLEMRLMHRFPLELTNARLMDCF